MEKTIVSRCFPFRRALQVFLTGFAFLLASCSDDEPTPSVSAYPTRPVPVEIRIPASGAERRVAPSAPGDPGTGAGLPLPDYLYIYVVTDNGRVARLAPIAGIRDRWQLTANGAVYRYASTIDLPEISSATSAKACIVASSDALDLGEVSTLSDVENLRLDLGKAANASVWIRDVYSNMIEIEGYNQKVQRVEAVLYHVAAKVDMQWNLTDRFLQDNPGWTIGTVGLRRLLPAGYLFDPGRNLSSPDADRSFDFRTDPGNEIYGRTDTYVFQTQDAALQYEIILNGPGGDTRTASGTVVPTSSGDADRTYAAYYRIDFTINGLPSR